MGKMESFVKLSSFQYASQILTIISAIVYSFVAANFLGPEKYGLIYYLVGFIAGIPLLLGFESFYDALKVYLARYKSLSFLKKIFSVAITLLLLLTAVCMLFPDFVLFVVGKGSKDLIIIFSLVIFFVPLVSLFESVFMGFKQFGKILLLVVVGKISELALLLLFLFVLNLDYMSLFYSTLFSAIIVLVFALFFARKIKFAVVKVPSAEIKKFVFQSWFSNVAKGFVTQSELWVFGLLLGLGEFGIFYLVKKIVIYLFEAPQIAISEVISPFLSEEKNIKNSVSYTSKVVKFQIVLGVLIAIISVIVVPFILPLLFPKFLPGVAIFPIFVLGYVLYFGSPLTRLLKVTNNNNLLTLSSGFYTALIVIFGFVLIPLWGLFGAVVALSSARILSGISLYVLCRYKGYHVAVIPNLADLKFFFSVSIILLKKVCVKAKRVLLRKN